MIDRSIPLQDLAPRLPAGRSGTRLRIYARPDRGMLAGDGRRWAVIICPGGAYRVVAPAEGEPVALAYLAAGVQAFVLDYSVAPDCWPQAFLELAASVAWVREHAKQFGVDPRRIAVCGFSAGGHLAGCLANLWADPVIGEKLGLSPEQVRPDAAILSYPVITASGPFACQPCFEALMGRGAETPAKLSLEESVTRRNPPAFLWATVTDATVPVENTIAYAATLRAAGVPFELHLFSDGPHAMGLATAECAYRPEQINPHAAHWHELSVEWLRRLDRE